MGIYTNVFSDGSMYSTDSLAEHIFMSGGDGWGWIIFWWMVGCVALILIGWLCPIIFG